MYANSIFVKWPLRAEIGQRGRSIPPRKTRASPARASPPGRAQARARRLAFFFQYKIGDFRAPNGKFFARERALSTHPPAAGHAGPPAQIDLFRRRGGGRPPFSSGSVSRANKAAKKKWPPVEQGHELTIYCPADLADYLQAECAALVKVNEGGSPVCCEVGCIKPDFGSSIKTRAPYNAALHLRSRHLVLRARATAAAAACVPKPKLAKAGVPVGSAAGAAARLGMALVPRGQQAGAARLREHAAAQAHNPPPPRPRRVFCSVSVAPSAAPGVFFS